MLARRFPASSALAFRWLAMARIAAASRTIEPFDHGIWPVAYLFLVGFLAHCLLARGPDTLVAAGQPSADAPPIRAQATFWNARMVAVPVGVFVTRGYWSSLAALPCLPRSGRIWQHPAFANCLSDSPNRLYGADRVIAASALVGTTFAWDTPWL
jgi:hypothetical protein